MELFYNNNIEVVKLIQQWMPFIHIINDSENSQNIIDEIKKNYDKFLDEY